MEAYRITSQVAIEEILSDNSFMRELHSRIVPLIVEHDVFWMRYFYRLSKLQQREELVKRASKVDLEDDLSWDVEDPEPSTDVSCSPKQACDEEPTHTSARASTKKKDSGIAHSCSFEKVPPPGAVQVIVPAPAMPLSAPAAPTPAPAAPAQAATAPAQAAPAPAPVTEPSKTSPFNETSMEKLAEVTGIPLQPLSPASASKGKQLSTEGTKDQMDTTKLVAVQTSRLENLSEVSSGEESGSLAEMVSKASDTATDDSGGGDGGDGADIGEWCVVRSPTTQAPHAGAAVGHLQSADEASAIKPDQSVSHSETVNDESSLKARSSVVLQSSSAPDEQIDEDWGSWD